MSLITEERLKELLWLGERETVRVWEGGEDEEELKKRSCWEPLEKYLPK